MSTSIEAVGRDTSIQTIPDVSSADGNSGKVEQTAATKSSRVVTLGAQNRAASAVERATEKAQKHDAILRHDKRTIPAGEFLGENNVNQIV